MATMPKILTLWPFKKGFADPLVNEEEKGDNPYRGRLHWENVGSLGMNSPIFFWEEGKLSPHSELQPPLCSHLPSWKNPPPCLSPASSVSHSTITLSSPFQPPPSQKPWSSSTASPSPSQALLVLPTVPLPLPPCPLSLPISDSPQPLPEPSPTPTSPHNHSCFQPCSSACRIIALKFKPDHSLKPVRASQSFMGKSPNF